MVKGNIYSELMFKILVNCFLIYYFTMLVALITRKYFNYIRMAISSLGKNFSSLTPTNNSKLFANINTSHKCVCVSVSVQRFNIQIKLALSKIFTIFCKFVHTYILDLSHLLYNRLTKLLVNERALPYIQFLSKHRLSWFGCDGCACLLKKN